MPPVLDAAPAGAELFSALSTMTTAVVRNSAAIEAAFCRAERVTPGRVDDASLDQVAVLAGDLVQALARAQVADLLRDAALESGVDRDLLERLLDHWRQLRSAARVSRRGSCGHGGQTVRSTLIPTTTA